MDNKSSRKIKTKKVAILPERLVAVVDTINLAKAKYNMAYHIKYNMAYHILSLIIRKQHRDKLQDIDFHPFAYILNKISI